MQADMSIESRVADHTARPSLFILIAMSAIGPIALNIFIPSMPGLQATFATDYATVQLTLTFYLAALAVAQLFIGPISDRFGRRPVFLCGTVVYVFASIACLFAGSIEQLIVGRIFQAAGGSAGIVLARAIVRDVYERDQAASMIGYVTMAMVVAPMLSPAIGGVLDQWAGWQSGFYLVTVLGVVLLAFAWTQLPETNHQRAVSAGFARLARNCTTLLGEPLFLGYAFNSAFGSCIFFSFLAGAPYVTTEVMGGTPAQYGFYFILVSFGYMFGNFLSGRFAQRAGVDRMVTSGTLIALGGLTVLVTFTVLDIQQPYAIFAPMGLVAISNGLNIPSATAGAISVRPEFTGAGAGLAGFFQLGLGASATLVVGALHDGTRLPMVITMVGSGLLATAFLGVIYVASKRRTP